MSYSSLSLGKNLKRSADYLYISNEKLCQYKSYDPNSTKAPSPAKLKDIVAHILKNKQETPPKALIDRVNTMIDSHNARASSGCIGFIRAILGLGIINQISDSTAPSVAKNKSRKEVSSTGFTKPLIVAEPKFEP